jgi:hypothetical protein
LQHTVQFTAENENERGKIDEEHRSKKARQRTYSPDGERVSKTFGGTTTYYLEGEADITFNSVNPSGLLSSQIHADIRREGTQTLYLIKDHLASNRLTIPQSAAALQAHAYGPYGNPRITNAATIPTGKGYINERVACPREGGGPRNRPAISPRQILRPRPRPLPHPRLVGPVAR